MSDARAVLGVHHGGVSVSDIDASLAFYRDGLGLEVTLDAVRDAAMGYRSRSPEVVSITSGGNAGGRIVYVADPDGYWVELLERPASHAGRLTSAVERAAPDHPTSGPSGH